MAVFDAICALLKTRWVELNIIKFKIMCSDKWISSQQDLYPLLKDKESSGILLFEIESLVSGFSDFNLEMSFEYAKVDKILTYDTFPGRLQVIPSPHN